MVFTLKALVFLTLSGWALSDHFDDGFHHENKNIFHTPFREPCGTLGKCLPLKDCPYLRERAERGDNKEIASIIKDFGCGFRTVVHVCCTEKDYDPSKDFPPFMHHHSHHPSEMFPHPPPFNIFSSSWPVHEDSFGESDLIEGDRPKKKGTNSAAVFPDNEDSVKPVYEKPEDMEEKKPVQFNLQGNQKDFTTPLWGDLQFIVPQKDSWYWPTQAETNNPLNNDTYSKKTPVPDWRDTPGESTGFHSQGNSGQGFLIGKPNQGGFSADGWNQGSRPTIQTGYQGFHGSNRPDNQEFLGGHSTSGSNYDRPSNFGSDSSYVQGISGGDSLLNQGFGVSGSIDRPTYQGFNNRRPGQSGLSNQGSSQFSSSTYERPSQGSFGTSRPGSQSFGNERPGSSGLNRPNNYDTDYSRPSTNTNRPGNSRPGNKRPTNQGNYNEPDSYGSNSFTNGQTNNQRPDSQRPNYEGSKKRPGNSGSNKKQPNRRLLPDGNCGTEISDKIIGGQDTSLDEYPWMALLHFSTRNGQDRGYGCGGSLINERYVLTAAHCIKGPSLPQNTIVNTVRLGEYDITKSKDCINGVCSPSPIDAAVEEIIVHPEYKPNDKAQYHDIALIRLRKKVPFSAYVSPICLPGDELKSKDHSGKQLVVAGWGKTANGDRGKSSSTKQKVSLPYVALENCKPFYDGINIRLRNTQMCAGGEKDKDSCQGDSGGPLMSNEMVNGQSSWYATGIVSFGPEDCGVKNIAGVYTKVSEYVDWILENIKE